MSRIVLALLSLLCFGLPACSKSDGGFGIYLADTDVMVLSVDGVWAYHSLDCTFELNAQGIERWNSFQTYAAEPKLAQGLYQRDFIIKLSGNELCRGKFYSMVSSMSYDGLVILDSVVKLDADRNSIKLDFGYPATIPGSAVAADKNRITKAIEQYFYVRYKLVNDTGFWAS